MSNPREAIYRQERSQNANGGQVSPAPACLAALLGSLGRLVGFAARRLLFVLAGHGFGKRD